MQLDFFFGCVARLQLLAMVRQRRTISTVALSLACAWLTPRASTLHVSCSAHSALSAPAAAAVVRSSFSRHVLHAAAAAELPMRSKGGRRAVKTDDGTVVTFVNPSPEDLLAAGLPSALGRGALAVAAVVDSAAAPVLLALIAPIHALGGSSLATWTFGLQRLLIAPSDSSSSSSSSSSADHIAVSEAVQHALTHEAIARFLNAGARVAQLRGLSADAEFLAQHGFLPLRSDTTGTAAGTTAAVSTTAAAAATAVSTAAAVLLAEPALLTSPPAGATSATGDSPLSRPPSDWTVAADRAAVQGRVTAALTAAPRDATLANILARLLHDAGDMQGAVDAYMRAVQIDPSRGEVFRRCVLFFGERSLRTVLE
eukprot:13692-Heterococcus_DN1.PRE.8